jgi:hypothetical protein
MRKFIFVAAFVALATPAIGGSFADDIADTRALIASTQKEFCGADLLGITCWADYASLEAKVSDLEKNFSRLEAANGKARRDYAQKGKDMAKSLFGQYQSISAKYCNCGK